MNRMAIALAGLEAERRAELRPQRHSWDEDRRTAVWLGYDLCAGDDELTQLYLKLARRRAQLLIGRNWEGVGRVANALIAELRSGYADAHKLVWPQLQSRT